jgi:hypothetical protein
MRNARSFAAAALLAATVAAPASVLAEPSLSANPSLPQYGQAVQFDLYGTSWPLYLPATRFTRVGNTITIDYEYATDGFGPGRPDFGYMPVAIGELPAGNYTVQARLFDINQPKAGPQVVTSSLAVRPPEAWGIYTVPANPLAFQAAEVMVRSAAYFDAKTLRSTVMNNVIRVDFDYDGSAPVVSGGSSPPGMTSFAAVKVAGLAPGNYRVEGWGRDARKGGNSERYFVRDVAIGTTVQVVEYYAETLDHYFITAMPEEVGYLDGSPNLGWKRSGQSFKAWLRAADAPPGAVPVCRFYASGPNSHFYTGDAAECDYLKSIEQKQRADAAAQGKSFTGWKFEAIGFYALVPQAGKCPGDTQPVYREYNNRAMQNDSNHRFNISQQLRAAMMMGWAEEGVAFCAPL